MDATLEFNLKQLKLNSFLMNYKKEAEEGMKRKISYTAYLENLSSLEVMRRTNLIIQSRLKSARFPAPKTIDTFDFTHVPKIDKKIIFQLAEGHFTSSAKNIIFFGPCGTGKTHLSIALGRELCLKKYKVFYSNVNHFINLLLEANHNLKFNQFIKKMQSYDLTILDELGYVPFEQTATNLLFQFLAEQYEKRSLLITTNLAFSQWDQIFKEKQTTLAAVDRLIHHSYVLHFEGRDEKSFRLKSSLMEKEKMRKSK
jgi:DNA replication protein DnaC